MKQLFEQAAAKWAKCLLISNLNAAVTVLDDSPVQKVALHLVLLPLGNNEAARFIALNSKQSKGGTLGQ